MEIPVPFNEVARLEALCRYDLEPCHGDRDLDPLVELAASICRTPIAALGFVERNRTWFKSAIGVTVWEVPRRGGFAAHVVCHPDELLVISDARRDGRFSNSPLVTDDPHLRFYAAAPLVEASDHAIGVLAVGDSVARDLSEDERSALVVLAQQAVRLLDLRQAVRRLEGEICERARYERQNAAFQRQLRCANELLTVASVTDSLTRLGNRRGFEQRLSEEIDRANRMRYPLSLLMIDIDHFKQINDTYGHPAGDEAMQEVAVVLARTARSTDFVSRLGGDEFAVILPDTDLLGAEIIAERCRAGIEAWCWPYAPVRISVGAGQLASGARDGTGLIAAADQSLLCAKRAGRNRVSLCGGGSHLDVPILYGSSRISCR